MDRPTITPPRATRPHAPLLSRALSSFHPRHVPAVSRRNYRKELTATALFPVALAAVEGGVIAAIIKTAFTGRIPDLTSPALRGELLLNFIVGALYAMPEMANLSSFLWASISNGRDKVRFIASLQAVIVACVVVVALTLGGVFQGSAGDAALALGMTPAHAPLFELILLLVVVATARVAMAGVFTLRATVWSMNYSRAERALATGRFSAINVLILAPVGLLMGRANDASSTLLMWIMLAAAAVGIVGVLVYRTIRLRGRRVLVKAELAQRASEDTHAALAPMRHLVDILNTDRAYARFQLWMNLVGVSNLMLTGPLLLMLKEDFKVTTFQGVLLTFAIPCVVMPLAIPFWARFLAGRHVVAFRAVHSWVFVVGQGVILLGAVLESLPLIAIGMAIQGVGYAGGSLAWNLGHLDFAPPHLASRYMGVHVTLNGVRGLLGPIAAVALYEWLKSAPEGSWLDRAGAEHWVVALSVVLAVAGAWGFVRLARDIRGEPS